MTSKFKGTYAFCYGSSGPLRKDKEQHSEPLRGPGDPARSAPAPRAPRSYCPDTHSGPTHTERSTRSLQKHRCSPAPHQKYATSSPFPASASRPGFNPPRAFPGRWVLALFRNGAAWSTPWSRPRSPTFGVPPPARPALFLRPPVAPEARLPLAQGRQRFLTWWSRQRSVPCVSLTHPRAPGPCPRVAVVTTGSGRRLETPRSVPLDQRPVARQPCSGRFEGPACGSRGGGGVYAPRRPGVPAPRDPPALPSLVFSVPAALTDARRYLTGALICILTSGVEHPSLLAIRMSSLGKCLLRSFAHFLQWVIIFFPLS